MKKILIVFSSIAALIANAGVEIVSPAVDATVPLLSKEQKSFLAMPRLKRRNWMMDEKRREEMKAYGWHPQSVVLRWKAERRADVKVFLDGRCVFSTNHVRSRVTVDNLEIARKYDWVVDSHGEMAHGSFRTEDIAPRLLKIENVANARDLGGRIGMGGRRVRQGMALRTAGLNKNASSDCLNEEELRNAWKNGELEKTLSGTLERGKGETPDVKYWVKCLGDAFSSGAPLKRDYTRKFAIPGTEKPGEEILTASSKYFLLDVIGVKSDVDLRSDYECFGMKDSPLGSNVKWFHYPSCPYAEIHSKKGKDAFRSVFKVFLDKDNYPIAFHCIAGQDRTGTVAFVLNGLLGVDEEELYRDWEVSAFWNKRMNFCHKHKFDKLVKSFNSLEGETLHDRIASFVRSLGFTDADIEKFRGIMLE